MTATVTVNVVGHKMPHWPCSSQLKQTHCSNMTFQFLLECAEQHIQAHAELMTKAGRCPALAEPTPLRRWRVLRLTHTVRQKSWSHESPRVCAHWGAYESRQKGRGGEAANGRDGDEGQALSDMHQFGRVSLGDSRIVRSYTELEINPERSSWAPGWHRFTVFVVENRILPPSFLCIWSKI